MKPYHPLLRRHILHRLHVDLAQVLNVDGAPQLVHLVIALRVQRQERLPLIVHKVLQNRIRPEVSPPLQMTREHRLCLGQIVRPRPQEPAQVVVVERRVALDVRRPLQELAELGQQLPFPLLRDPPELFEGRIVRNLGGGGWRRRRHCSSWQDREDCFCAARRPRSRALRQTRRTCVR